MALRLNIALLGDAALQKQLRSLTDKLERTVVQQALDTGIRQVVLPAVKAATPVGQPRYRLTKRKQKGRAFATYTYRKRPGGRLRATLKARPLRRKRRRVGAGVYTGTKSQLGIRGNSYYPAHLEFGFVHTSGRRIPARKYMKIPLIRTQSRTLAVVAQAMRAGIDREIRPL